MLSRKESLLKLTENSDKELVLQLVDEVIFLEDNLIQLKKLPFININPNNPQQQKATPAAKQYKEFLQQYINCLKVLAHSNGNDFENEESPLRKWVKTYMISATRKNVDEGLVPTLEAVLREQGFEFSVIEE